MTLRRKLGTTKKVFNQMGIRGILILISEKVKFSRKRNLVTRSEFIENGYYLESLTSQTLVEILEISHEFFIPYEEEFLRLENDLKARAALPRRQFFETVYDLGDSMTRFLYISTRVLKPKCIIETGVAAGVSSTVLLSAIEMNAQGTLLSVDISKNVGEIIPEELKKSWILKILPLRKQKSGLKKILASYGGATIFLHDSNHSDRWQKFEFDSAFRALSNCRIFIFDDITLSLLNHVRLNIPEAKIYVVDEGRKQSAIFLRR